MNLTLQELIILIIGILVVASIIVSIVKSSLKILMAVIIAVILFSGFTWLPEMIGKWTGSGPQVEEVDPGMSFGPDDALVGMYETGKDFVNKNKDSWIESAQSLWQKITGSNGQ